MGMYTGIRFKGIIKEEFSDLINKMMEEHLDWNELFATYPQYEFLNEFSKYPRANSIPYGSLSYMPDEWEIEARKKDGSYDWANFKPTDGFDKTFDPQTRLWAFQCSLKNYDAEIQGFLKLVLPQLTEKIIHLEYYYEEWARSKFYELKDREIVESNREGILYGYEEEEERWY